MHWLSDRDHEKTNHSLWVFTPSRTAPEDLESIFVQRHDLLQDSVERLRESALTNHKHHLLFVGPRGCGKTHLVTLLVGRTTGDEQIGRKSRIAWLNEDETCTSILELLIKVHTALEKRYPNEFRADGISDAYGLDPAEALQFVKERLLKTLGKKTLIVVAENLDALFAAMGDAGQKQLRSLIQKHPQFALIATAQRLVDDLTNRSKPFFGFFQTEHLKPLTVPQAMSLLQKIAKLRGKDDVVDFLQSGRGEARVRALHHLSGGNHRIYVVLSQFITRQSMDALIGPFLKMVDELTPYYQERLRWLPTLQRKIVEFLCNSEGTVAVKEIARKLFSSPQTISSQLHDLREKGYVESNQRGRESLYEISEPLMRICVEVKENQTTQPIRLLVDFLRVWYDDTELGEKYEADGTNSLTKSYLGAAIQQNVEEGNLRKRILLKYVFDEVDDRQIHDLTKYAKYIPEPCLLALACAREGDASQAIEYLNEPYEPTDDEKTEGVSRIFFRGCIHNNLKNYELAIADFSSVLALQELPDPLALECAINRAEILVRLGNYEDSIVDSSRVIASKKPPHEILCRAFFIRGLASAQLPNIPVSQAISDLTQAIEIQDTPHTIKNCARLIRGTLRMGDNDAGAIDDFTTFIETEGVNAPESSILGRPAALVNRGLARLNLGQRDLAREDIESAVSDRACHIDKAIEGYLALANLHAEDGRWKAGFAAIEAAWEIASAKNTHQAPSPFALIDTLFSAGLTSDGRTTHATRLVTIYSRYSATPLLGDALVKQIGKAFRRGAPWPSSDNLAQWLSAWEAASEGLAEMRLPLRLLRIAIRFINSGGKDAAVLLDLNSTERSILRQALAMGETED